MANESQFSEFEEKFFSNINKNLYEFDRFLGRTEDADNKAFQDTDKIAFRLARKAVVQNSGLIITKIILDAMSKIPEYNYDLYMNHMAQALNFHMRNLIKIDIRSNENAEIIVDLNPLGDISLWAQAVAIAREQIESESESKKPKPFKGKKASPDLSSNMWREKIYRVDREGGKVYKTVKIRSGKNKDGKRQYREEQKDITYKFEGKYRSTIQKRLEFLPPDTAPFWYLVEHGNPSTMPGEGTAYPKHRGSPFIHKIISELESSLRAIYREKRSEIRGRLEEIQENRRDELLRQAEIDKDASEFVLKMRVIEETYTLERVTKEYRVEVDIKTGARRGRNALGRIVSLK